MTLNLGSVDSLGVVKMLNAFADQLQADSKFRDSVKAIKFDLAQGKIVICDRRSGKTTALIEFVHEHNPSNTIIVCCNYNAAQLLRDDYRRAFPSDAQPRIVSIQNVRSSGVQGTDRQWITDEVWPEAVMLRSSSYRWAKCLGGVGTAECMDMAR